MAAAVLDPVQVLAGLPLGVNQLVFAIVVQRQVFVELVVRIEYSLAATCLQGRLRCVAIFIAVRSEARFLNGAQHGPAVRVGEMLASRRVFQLLIEVKVGAADGVETLAVSVSIAR